MAVLEDRDLVFFKFYFPLLPECLTHNFLDFNIYSLISFSVLSFDIEYGKLLPKIIDHDSDLLLVEKLTKFIEERIHEILELLFKVFSHQGYLTEVYELERVEEELGKLITLRISQTLFCKKQIGEKLNELELEGNAIIRHVKDRVHLILLVLKHTG